MCGIGAVYGFNLNNGESLIRKSLEAVKHRGYSLYETAVMDNCVLGANRLEIVDAKNARQPQVNEDKTVFVVFNGEIFNHKTLRAELVEKKHRFRTESDSEVLVHLWEEYGPEMVKKLDSEMFAFFVYDKRTNSFFAARDPYGVKPLYYSLDSFGNRHFASEIKQLVQFAEISEVHEFPPGHHMLDGELVRYHSIPKPEEMICTDSSEIIVQLRRLFDNAVRKRVDTSLPIAVFFSGGIDSASVLATARKFHKDITAITMGHQDSSDFLTAKRYCDENSIKLTRVRQPESEEILRLFPQLVRMTESFDQHVVFHAGLYHFISEQAKRSGFKVILCGEGGDELFCGYPWFKHAKEAELPGLVYDFVAELYRTQFQRLDRATMSHTVEARAPFLDTEFADYVCRIPPNLKLKTVHGRKVAKWILREAMKDRLPSYIYDRPKVPMNDGVLNVAKVYEGHLLNAIRESTQLDRVFPDLVDGREFRNLKRLNPSWNISNRTEAHLFKQYAACLYTKAVFNKERHYRYVPSIPLWKKTLDLVSEFKSTV